jgi:hypothetical protein
LTRLCQYENGCYFHIKIPGAFFAAPLSGPAPQKTGLSACIFFACGKKGYRFYPLRGKRNRRLYIAQMRHRIAHNECPQGKQMRPSFSLASARRCSKMASAPSGLCCKEIDCTTPLCGLYIRAIFEL